MAMLQVASLLQAVLIESPDFEAQPALLYLLSHGLCQVSKKIYWLRSIWGKATRLNVNDIA